MIEPSVENDERHSLRCAKNRQYKSAPYVLPGSLSEERQTG